MEINNLIENYKKLEKQYKELEKEMKSVKEEIIAYMLANELDNYDSDKYYVNYKQFSRVDLDKDKVKALLEANNLDTEEYSKVISYYRADIKEKKEK